MYSVDAIPQRNTLILLVTLSGIVVPRPLPPKEWPGTRCLRMRIILRYILRKNTVNLLTHVELYAEYYSNQEYGLLFWDHDEMSDLTYRICLSAVEEINYIRINHVETFSL